ncbi:MAG: hypothetical protein ACT4PK_03145 [Gammaproteobacteria bacterium]
MANTSRILCLSVALLLGACATVPAPSATTGETPKAATVATCPQESGATIKLPEGCVGMAGRAYTRSQVEQTGEMSLGRALYLMGAI